MGRARRGTAAKGKRRPRAAAKAAAVAGDGHEETKDGPEKAAGGGGGFFCCYLLRSLCPRSKSRTYIGFTVNPRRRIRQHNGELRCGAWRTKRGRPWEMMLCIYGFPTNVAALQFEWAWQHPTESLAVRKAAAEFKSLGGIGNKVKLAYTMLNLPSWENLNLTVNFFSTKNTKFTAGCPPLPCHMKTVVSPMEDLPCYVEGLSSEDDIMEPREDEEERDAAVGGDTSDHGLQTMDLGTGIVGGESDTDEFFAPMDRSEVFASGISESSAARPEEEETRSAGCDVEYTIDDFGESDTDEFFAPMEGSEVCGSRISESSGAQPVEEETRIADSDVEYYPTDDFSYMEWGGIHETSELHVSRTPPRCSSSSCSDDVAGRSVNCVTGEASPVLKAGSDDGNLFFHEIDVVDLVTPVARYARDCSKVASICPKIIDLTNSPIVIEL
ncbi:uncharacterized protein LOC125514291 [Triticum urartu]|nr:uncharacterized protein LOC125514291 [Triticum urartu]